MTAPRFVAVPGIIALLLGGTTAQAIDLAAIKAGKYPTSPKEEAHVCAALFGIAQLMEQADQERSTGPDPAPKDGSESALSPAQQRLDAEAIAEAKAESDNARSAMFGRIAESWGNKAAKLDGQHIDSHYRKTLQSDADNLASLKSKFPMSRGEVRAFPDLPSTSWLGRCYAKIRAYSVGGGR